MSPNTRRTTAAKFARIVDGAYALGAVALVLVLAGLVCVAAGIWAWATRDDASRMTEAKAMVALDEIGQSLCQKVVQVVRPAMNRTEIMAAEPQVAAGLLAKDRSKLTEICNTAITHSSDVDAIAAFDDHGKIVAINTLYASGEPIAPNRLDRILQADFQNREIIQRCFHNRANDRSLEFQTACDITPALFDSTGLSVAYSVPVVDRSTNKRIGVVSSRLRFERLTNLIKSIDVGGRDGAIAFVTDQGSYFSEQINSGRQSPPVDPRLLSEIVAPLARKKADYSFTRIGSNFLALMRLNGFTTNYGRGVQVMVLADQSWLVDQARVSRDRQCAGMITAGLILILLSGLLHIHGIAPLRHSARRRVTAERANSETQQRFELAVRGTNDGICDWNLDTGEAFWSPRVSEMLGYTTEEFGNTLDSIVSRMHPEDRQRALESLAERIRRHEPSKSEFRLLTKSGEYLWVQGRGQAVYDDDGRPYRFAGALTDISERKQMEAELARRDAQLRQSHKLEAVGSLAGGISHEFNNLLQVIRGYGKYAMQGLATDDQRYMDLEQVIQAADRAATLTQQLLGFSRLQVLERAGFDHREVLRDLVKLLRPVIGEHIELDVELPPEEIPIHADRGMLQQMLLNLCINARDAMPTGGRLSLRTQRVDLSEKYCKCHPDMRPGSYVLFTVADTGFGMPPEVRERIFEPFFTTKGVGKGTGLGLAMVYGGVQQHGGMINVYSEVGVGTTFRIYLPIAANLDVERIEESPAAAGGGEETILIAEDEAMVRDLAVRILRAAGYSVVVAADGAQAVELFKHHAETISLVLLDAIMPKLTGHEAYDRIQLIRPDVPAIFCSGYDPETGQLRALMEKGCRLIQKPYDPDVLLKAVRDVLDIAHSIRVTEYSGALAT